MKEQKQILSLETERLMKLTQVADYLGRPRVAAWRMAKRGQLHPLRFGGKNLFFMREEVEGLGNAPSKKGS